MLDISKGLDCGSEFATVFSSFWLQVLEKRKKNKAQKSGKIWYLMKTWYKSCYFSKIDLFISTFLLIYGKVISWPLEKNSVLENTSQRYKYWNFYEKLNSSWIEIKNILIHCIIIILIFLYFCNNTVLQLFNIRNKYIYYVL